MVCGGQGGEKWRFWSVQLLCVIPFLLQRLLLLNFTKVEKEVVIVEA